MRANKEDKLIAEGEVAWRVHVKSLRVVRDRKLGGFESGLLSRFSETKEQSSITSEHEGKLTMR